MIMFLDGSLTKILTKLGRMSEHMLNNTFLSHWDGTSLFIHFDMSVFFFKIMLLL